MLLLLLAVEAPVPAPDPSATVSVQVALIGALAPVILVIVNEIFKRWRNRGADAEPHKGVLAPVEEVPRAQFDELLDRISDMDERAHEATKQHESDRQRWLTERRDLEQRLEQSRREVISEMERRVRAETMLQANQGGPRAQ